MMAFPSPFSNSPTAARWNMRDLPEAVPGRRHDVGTRLQLLRRDALVVPRRLRLAEISPEPVAERPSLVARWHRRRSALAGVSMVSTIVSRTCVPPGLEALLHRCHSASPPAPPLPTATLPVSEAPDGFATLRVPLAES